MTDPAASVPEPEAPGWLARRWSSVHPPFRRLLLSQFAHGAGDALVAVALAGTLFFDVPLGEARDRVGLYLLIAMTPYALLSPIVGPMLDRWRNSYRLAVVVAAAARAVLAAFMASRTDRLLLYPLAFGVLVLSRAHAVSRAAIAPSVAPAGRPLMWVNARLALAALAGGIMAAGPAVGLRSISAWPVLWLAAGVFAAGTVVSLGLPGNGAAQRVRTVERGEHRRLPVGVLSAAFATGSIRAAIGFLTFFLAFALRAQGGSSGAFGLALAAAALGGTVGSFVAPGTRAFPGGVVLAVALGGIGAVSWAMVPGFGARNAAILSGVAAMGAALGRFAFDSLVQRDAPEHVRGRVFARYETVFQLVWVGGAGLATAVPFGVGPGLRTSAVICLVGLIGAAGARARARGPANPPLRSET